MNLNEILTLIQNMIKTTTKEQFLAICGVVYDVVVSQKKDDK